MIDLMLRGMLQQDHVFSIVYHYIYPIKHCSTKASLNNMGFPGEFYGI